MAKEIFIFRTELYLEGFLNKEFLMGRITFSFSKTVHIIGDKFKIIHSMAKEHFIQTLLLIEEIGRTVCHMVRDIKFFSIKMNTLAILYRATNKEKMNCLNGIIT
jgi:hypothetical protein